MEVRVGLLPDVGGCSRLPAVVGLGNAKELIMTGKVIDGREAHRIGFANRIAPADELDAGDRGARERAARVRAARGRAGEARDGRGGQAGARAHAGAGGRGAGDAGGVRGLRGGRAARSSRSATRTSPGARALDAPRAAEGSDPCANEHWSAPEMRRARMPWSGPIVANAGAGSGEPICAENRPRRLSLGYTRTRKVKPRSTNSRSAPDSLDTRSPGREPQDPRREQRHARHDEPRRAVAGAAQQRAERGRAGGRARRRCRSG